MVSPVIIGVSAVALFLQSVTVPKTGLTQEHLSAGQQEVLFRVCKSVAPDQLERCKARQLRTLNVNASIPSNAYDTYDGIDLGNGKLRERLKAKRKAEAETRAAARKSFGQDPNAQTTELQPRNYVEFIREERLKCMLTSPGRPRSICLDELASTARKMMQDARMKAQTTGQ